MDGLLKMQQIEHELFLKPWTDFFNPITKISGVMLEDGTDYLLTEEEVLKFNKEMHKAFKNKEDYYKASKRILKEMGLE